MNDDSPILSRLPPPITPDLNGVPEQPQDIVPLVELPRIEDLPPDATDSFGFIVSQKRPLVMEERLDVKKYRRLENRWISVINEFGETSSTEIKLLCRQGIPVSVRGRVWQLLVKSQQVADTYEKSLFDKLIKQSQNPTPEQQLVFDVIQRDIRRSYPDHFLFISSTPQATTPALDALTSILRCFALLDQHVGYCQGMGRIVGMLLMHMTVEEAFWCLVALTKNGILKDYFSPDLRRVRLHALVFDRLLSKYLPRVHRHLTSNDVDPLVYCTNWFLTVYTLALPWHIVLRVWDVALQEGTKVIFRCGLAVMTVVQKHLLTRCPTSQEIIPFILHLPAELFQDAGKFMELLCRGYSRLGSKECQVMEAALSDEL